MSHEREYKDTWEYRVEQAWAEGHAAGVRAERERCAQIVESWDIENDPDDLYTGREHLAAALRAPGRTT